MRERLTSSGAANIDCDLFDEGSPYMHPFSEVNSLYKQLVFYRKHFNLIVCREGGRGGEGGRRGGEGRGEETGGGGGGMLGSRPFLSLHIRLIATSSII